MSAHTPGPWNRGVAQHVYQGERWDPSNQQRLIACCEPTTRTQADWEETWANARLIAAAPEMLAALEELAHALTTYTHANETDWPELAAARAVIAKAKGD